MAEVINLRLARKAKKRTDKERQAEANRASFGESKVGRMIRMNETNRAKRTLDGAKLGDN